MESQFSPSPSLILGRLLEPVECCLTPEGARELVNLKADAVVQALLEALVDTGTEGEISADEKLEYETYVCASACIEVLQAHGACKDVDHGSCHQPTR